MTGELRTETFDLGEGDLDAFYDAELEAMAIHSRLTPEQYRARELEAHGYHVRPPRSGRKFSYTVRTPEDLDRVTVRALIRAIEKLSPKEVEEIADARRISGDPRLIAAYCEVDYQLVVAVLAYLNTTERGYSGL